MTRQTRGTTKPKRPSQKFRKASTINTNPYTGYTRPPTLPSMLHLQYQNLYGPPPQYHQPSRVHIDNSAPRKISSIVSPLKANAPSFLPGSRTSLPPEFRPQQEQHQRQDSGVNVPPVQEEEKEDIVIRTIRHRWERTRWKFEYPCLKCTTSGEKRHRKHKMVDCPWISAYEKDKILRDRKELEGQVEELGIEVDRSEPNADGPLIEGLRDTVKELLVMSPMEISVKIAEQLQEFWGDDLWESPCKRCQILFEGKKETNGNELCTFGHRIADCWFLDREARILLKRSRGEEVTEKEAEMIERIWAV